MIKFEFLTFLVQRPLYLSSFSNRCRVEYRCGNNNSKLRKLFCGRDMLLCIRLRNIKNYIF